MSEHLRMQQAGDAPDLELVLTVVTDEHIARPTRNPSPEEVAEVVMNSSDDWWSGFVRHVREKNRARHQALLDAFAPEVSADDTQSLIELRQAIDDHLGWKNKDDEERGEYPFRIREIGDAFWNFRAAVVGLKDKALAADIITSILKPADEDAGEVRPYEAPIARDPGARGMREELDQIDHVLETYGFDATRAVQELEGAFQRLRHLEIERGPLTTEAGRVGELLDKIKRQRFELRRLNRAERYRAEGAAAMKLHLLATERMSVMWRALTHVKANPPEHFTERSLAELTRLLEAAIQEDV